MAAYRPSPSSFSAGQVHSMNSLQQQNNVSPNFNRSVRFTTPQSNAQAYGGFGNNSRGMQASSPGASSSHSTVSEQLSTTNLYIRGLHNNTSDQDLREKYQRFGKIISTKAIIDTQNGECRGYGFVDFEHPQDAEQAIKEMTNEGAQVQMAKQQEQDPTNLYIANLPLSITDSDLKSICQPYGEVVSTRILLDKGRSSRGVGFVRMESKEMCEDIIKSLNQMYLTYPNLEINKHPVEHCGARDGPLTVKFADNCKKKNTYRNRSYDDYHNDPNNYIPNSIPYQFLGSQGTNHQGIPIGQGIPIHPNMMQNPFMINPMMQQFDHLAQNFNHLHLQSGDSSMQQIQMPYITTYPRQMTLEDVSEQEHQHYNTSSGYNQK